MVSINYRVGAFGLFCGADSSATGNIGIYDQLLALKWVHNNIEHFTELSNLKYRWKIFGLYFEGSERETLHELRKTDAKNEAKGVLNAILKNNLHFWWDRKLLF
jgi:hypothetical protein